MSKKLKNSMEAIIKAQNVLVAKEKLYVLGEFSAGLAHEIKNPLTAIKMLIQRAYEYHEPMDGEDLVIVKDELERIDKIVSRFLGYARKSEAVVEPVDINKLVKNVALLTKQRMEKSGVELSMKVDEAPLVCHVSRDGLQQVVMNLVLNALQAMPQGGLLTLAVKRDDRHVRIEVRDSGIGMTDEQLQRAFDPFFTTKENGTGLGLSIVGNIIETLHAEIEIFSQPHQGTNVVVSLPYA